MTEETLPQMTNAQTVLEDNTKRALDCHGFSGVVPHYIAKMLVDDLEGQITALKEIILDCPECAHTIEALNRQLEKRIKQMMTGRTSGDTSHSFTPLR